MIETWIINVLMVFMALAVWVIIRSRNLFGVIVMGGVYSFLTATVMVAMDAVDVAMTEAAVGAGISTVLFLSALYLCKGDEAKPMKSPLLPLLVSTGVGVMLVLARSACPSFPTQTRPLISMSGPDIWQTFQRKWMCPTSSPPSWRVIAALTHWAKQPWSSPQARAS